MTETDRGPCQYCGPDDDDQAIVYIDQLGESGLEQSAVCYPHGLKALADLSRADKVFMMGNLAFEAWGQIDWMYLGVCSNHHLPTAFMEFRREKLDEDVATDTYFKVLADKDCESCLYLGALWQERFNELCENMFGKSLVSVEGGTAQGGSGEFWRGEQESPGR